MKRCPFPSHRPFRFPLLPLPCLPFPPPLPFFRLCPFPLLRPLSKIQLGNLGSSVSSSSGSGWSPATQTVPVHSELKITLLLNLDSAFTCIVIRIVPVTYPFGVSQKVAIWFLPIWLTVPLPALSWKDAQRTR